MPVGRTPHDPVWPTAVTKGPDECAVRSLTRVGNYAGGARTRWAASPEPRAILRFSALHGAPRVLLAACVKAPPSRSLRLESRSRQGVAGLGTPRGACFPCPVRGAGSVGGPAAPVWATGTTTGSTNGLSALQTRGGTWGGESSDPYRARGRTTGRSCRSARFAMRGVSCVRGRPEDTGTPPLQARPDFSADGCARARGGHGSGACRNLPAQGRLVDCPTCCSFSGCRVARGTVPGRVGGRRRSGVRVVLRR